MSNELRRRLKRLEHAHVEAPYAEPGGEPSRPVLVLNIPRWAWPAHLRDSEPIVIGGSKAQYIAGLRRLRGEIE